VLTAAARRVAEVGRKSALRLFKADPSSGLPPALTVERIFVAIAAPISRAGLPEGTGASTHSPCLVSTSPAVIFHDVYEFEASHLRPGCSSIGVREK